MWSKIQESAILGALKLIWFLLLCCVVFDEMFFKFRNQWINFTIFFLSWSSVHTFQVSHLKIFFSIKPSCMNGNYSSLERHFFGCLINNFFENFVHLSSKYYDEPKKNSFSLCVIFVKRWWLKCRRTQRMWFSMLWWKIEKFVFSPRRYIFFHSIQKLQK